MCVTDSIQTDEIETRSSRWCFWRKIRYKTWSANEAIKAVLRDIGELKTHCKENKTKIIWICHKKLENLATTGKTQREKKRRETEIYQNGLAL